MKFSGQIKKMISKYLTPISYDIPIGNDFIPVSTFLDKIIEINFLNEIHCIECEREINKTFAQGYCYPCFINSPRTSECILKPELCRAHEGESRDIEWSKKHCLKEHFVYLSLTAGAKIGVTRATQIPTRWIDQGAVQALKFAKTSNRYEAGAIEVQMKNHISDRTAWQRMLKNEIDDSINLMKLKNELINVIGNEYKQFILENESVVVFEYPHINFPDKVKSLDLLKVNRIKARLIAIKGQYLLFDDNTVLNIRKHTGFKISLEVN
tara:strand:- start:171 stop:971 length:801 start_codon:yes stop_codon:yes gene_type:complete